MDAITALRDELARIEHRIAELDREAPPHRDLAAEAVRYLLNEGFASPNHSCRVRTTDA